jgi:leucyl/phenylalanyl-tRNA--protein transferase
VTSILDLPRLGADSADPFPPGSSALASPSGLLAWGGDLQPERLLTAYRSGIFPWYSEGQPILWWSPAPRCVIYPDAVHISRRLRRRLKQGLFTITSDQAFEEVIEACSGPRRDQDGTWITPEMLKAYVHLHELGVAHSVEVHMDGELAGGIYGLALGRMFFGESMFSKRDDASKIALVALCHQLQQWGFSLLDCQVSNPHLLSMGAQEVSRETFEGYLSTASDQDQWRQEFNDTNHW